MGTKLDQKKDKIIALLQNEGTKTYHQIDEHLKENGIILKGKGLNKILQKMKDEDQSIERLDKKPRALYRIRIDSNTIAEIHGTYFKERLNSLFLVNFENLFKEITKSNKIQDVEQNYIKSWIEFLGLYIFIALIESTRTHTKIEKQTDDKEIYKLIHVWLSSALSLERGAIRPSIMFEKMLKGFKLNKRESNTKTIVRMMLTFKKLYPNAFDIVDDVGTKSDEFLEIVKDQKYDSLTELKQVFGILTGETDKRTRKYLKEKALAKTFSNDEIKI